MTQKEAERRIMAMFNPRRFSKPETLRKIAPQHLATFLLPHAEFFKNHGLELSESRIDYDALSDVLLNSDDSIPSELAEALFYVDELATPQGFDSIQEAIEGTKLDATIDAQTTPADLAIQVWLHDRRIIERLHAEQFLTRPRSFEYFMTTGDVRDCRELSDAEMTTFEYSLNDWFEKKRRGRTAKVFVYPKPDFIWFQVRHGEPFTREPSINADNEESSEYFRPMKYDLLGYNRLTGEMRIHAKTKGEKELYRKRFGEIFFCDEEYFDSASKFTLTPLQEDGADALLCGDVDGLEEVKLLEVQIFRGGTHKAVEIHKAEDVFAVMEERNTDRSYFRGVFKASFSFAFRGSKTPRTVTITGNKALYKRDGDSVIIERWFVVRGFAGDSGGVR
jgi:hypothetical protein